MLITVPPLIGAKLSLKLEYLHLKDHYSGWMTLGKGIAPFYAMAELKQIAQPKNLTPSDTKGYLYLFRHKMSNILNKMSEGVNIRNINTKEDPQNRPIDLPLISSFL